MLDPENKDKEILQCFHLIEVTTNVLSRCKAASENGKDNGTNVLEVKESVSWGLI